MKFSTRAFRPIHVVLVLCLIVFLWNSNELASIDRDIAPAIAELQASNPGGKGAGMHFFIREYMSAPFGKAIGMSERQLQLCHHIFTRIPAYESASAWRNNALFIGLSTVVFLALKRKFSPGAKKLGFQDLRTAAQMLLRRWATAATPFVNRMQQRAAEKRTGATPSAVHNIVMCPECRQQLRVPAGKGRVRVTCSACGARFESVT